MVIPLLPNQDLTPMLFNNWQVMITAMLTISACSVCCNVHNLGLCLEHRHRL